MAKRVLITMSDEMYAALAQRRKKQAYLTIQEVVNDMLRRSLFSQRIYPAGRANNSKSKRGRPEKRTFEDYFSTPTKETRKLEREGLI